MKNAIIFHGTDASPESNWFGWLKDELEIIGYDVWLPQLPNWNSPNTAMLIKMVGQKAFVFNEETILIGHSSGAVGAMQLLPKIGVPIKATFLVSAFVDDLGRAELAALFDRELDYKMINQNGGKIVMFHSGDDPYVPIEHAHKIAEQTHAELIIEHDAGHFNTERSLSFRQFPALLGKIKGTLNELR